MQYTQEFNVDTFHWWSRAKAIVDDIRKAKKMDELQEHIEEVFFEKIPTATQLNDYVWFDSENIYKILGISNDEEEI